MNDETPVVVGGHTRYACRSVAEVDAHLKGLTDWLACNTPSMHAGKRRAVEAKYAPDIDKLLNARVMLLAWESIDDDLANLAVGIMRESDLVR